VGGLGKIYRIFTGGKDEHEPKSATKRSFDDDTYEPYGRVFQSPVGAMDDFNAPFALFPCLTSYKSGDVSTSWTSAWSPVRACQPSGGSTTLLRSVWPDLLGRTKQRIDEPDEQPVLVAPEQRLARCAACMHTSAYPRYSASVLGDAFGVTAHGGKDDLDTLSEKMKVGSMRLRHGKLGSTAGPRRSQRERVSCLCCRRRLVPTMYTSQSVSYVMCL